MVVSHPAPRREPKHIEGLDLCTMSMRQGYGTPPYPGALKRGADVIPTHVFSDACASFGAQRPPNVLYHPVYSSVLSSQDVR